MSSFPLHTIAAGVQQNIVTTLSLVDGTEYEFQNRTDNPIRVYDTGANPPDAEAGKEYLYHEVFIFTAAATPVWVWGVGGPAILAYDDDN